MTQRKMDECPACGAFPCLSSSAACVVPPGPDRMVPFGAIIEILRAHARVWLQIAEAARNEHKLLAELGVATQWELDHAEAIAFNAGALARELESHASRREGGRADD